MDGVEFSTDHGSVEEAIEALVQYAGTREAQTTYLERYGPNIRPHHGAAVDPPAEAPHLLEELPEEVWLDPSEA